MKRITISDVSLHAGVSKSTVSQYLNKRYEYMSKSTRQRIENSIKELDYSPNMIARSLTQKSTKTIGVIVANILHTFSTQVIRAVEDYCNEADFHVIVCNADDNPTKEKRYIDMLRDKQVDGIIVFPTGDNSSLYKSLVNVRYPIVFMDRIVPGVSVDTVLLDNEAASKLAVDLFVKQGYSRIGMISPSTTKNITPRLERITGFKNALEMNNIPFEPGYLLKTKTQHIKTGMDKMLNELEAPHALLASNDLVMFELLKYVKEKALKIPEDIAIIGIDDVSFANFYNPTLTTIAQPAFEMGKKAAQLLFEKIIADETKTETTIYRFPPLLLERSSSSSI